MKNLDVVLGGKNERVSMVACTGDGAGVTDGGWKSPIEEPLFDCLLRQCLWTRMVTPFGAVFVEVVLWEVKLYMVIGSTMVRGCDVIYGFVEW